MKHRMAKYDGLMGRWRPEWAGDNALGPLYGSMTGTVRAIEDIVGRHQKLTDEGQLTVKGLAEAMREHATKATVAAIYKADKEIDAHRERLAARRRALTVPAPDRTDVVAAMRRQDIRAALRAMPLSDRIGLLLREDRDPMTLEAVFEVPAFVSGLTQKTRDDVEQRLLKSLHGPALERIEDADAAAVLADNVVKVALRDLRELTGFEAGEDRDFEDFMTASTALIERNAPAPKPANDAGEPWLGDLQAKMDAEFAKIGFPSQQSEKVN